MKLKNTAGLETCSRRLPHLIKDVAGDVLKDYLLVKFAHPNPEKTFSSSKNYLLRLNAGVLRLMAGVKGAIIPCKTGFLPGTLCEL